MSPHAEPLYHGLAYDGVNMRQEDELGTLLRNVVAQAGAFRVEMDFCGMILAH